MHAFECQFVRTGGDVSQRASFVIAFQQHFEAASKRCRQTHCGKQQRQRRLVRTRMQLNGVDVHIAAR